MNWRCLSTPCVDCRRCKSSSPAQVSVTYTTVMPKKKVNVSHELAVFVHSHVHLVLTVAVVQVYLRSVT
ncbi:hypothetical protein J6590_054329 [Homalodisca vitripennis]|nr:hypothetical protein J6590_054329 [Homalodisca vitripennis]